MFDLVEIKVSIIVPNYNHGQFLEQRLESIFNQTFQDFEVILLDDASTDNSLEILEKYFNHPKVSQRVKNKKNSGNPFRQWKKGIDLAKGKYIWIAESDDLSHRGFLENIFECLQRNNYSSGIAYTQSLNIDIEGKTLNNRINWTEEFSPNIWEKDYTMSGEEFIQRFLKVKNVIPNASAVVFRKDLITPKTFTSNLLNMRMCGDWLFWIKLCEDTSISFVSKPLNYFREHPGITRNHDSFELKKNRLLEESEVRKNLAKNKRVKQVKEVRALYRKWVELQKTDFFKKIEFFNILVHKKDAFTLLETLLKSNRLW